MFVKTPKGHPMLLAYGYTFSKNSGIRRGGSRFACSKFLSKNCKAVVHVDKNNVILKAVYDHNHDPPEYTIQDGASTGRKTRLSRCDNRARLTAIPLHKFYTKVFLPVSFITLASSGKTVLLYQRHTFSKHSKYRGGFRYRCSAAMSRGCRAYVVINTANVVFKGVFTHTHEPPTLRADKDGRVVKIYKRINLGNDCR
ncbi:unnamed protein product [Plutella xylostella]|uniref:(diamondback moth) hypothetical protein n=1 Tax=Plutella xylostella TaxID=51655 RepID=A0A8S4GCJ5_PLUXY|nr:unnamed protein product [Plutella xylostella]